MGGTRPALRRRPAKKILRVLRDRGEIWLTNTGPRDTGQSDFKNRFTLYDMSKLVPVYDASGYFSVEIHGGARLHQDLLNNKIDPFEDARIWAEGMPNVLTPALIRSAH